VVNGVKGRAAWPNLRRLEAVIDSPVFLPDGSVLDAQGYDPQTELLYQPNAAEVPMVPAKPTAEQVRTAIGRLHEVVHDFPFKEPCHRSAWVAAILTPLARFAFAGPSPLFLIDANVLGAGKSRLADVVSIIVDGREMARTPYSEKPEEMRKNITTVALSGDRLILFDDIKSQLGGQALDAVLTSTIWKDRLLGKNENPSISLNTTWYATGNNVGINGDTIRRICHIRLESPEEDPESRTGFLHADLMAWTKSHRPLILQAALTLLVAYHQAGRPNCNIPAWGSYEGWSALVRNTIVWAGLPDPGDTRRELKGEADAEAQIAAALILGWSAVDPFGMGVTTAQVLRNLAEPIDPDKGDLYAGVREAVNSWGGLRGLTPRGFGMRLNHLRGRVVGGQSLQRRLDSDATSLWMVGEAPKSGPDAGTTGTAGTNYSADPNRNGKSGYLDFNLNEPQTKPNSEAVGNSPGCPGSPGAEQKSSYEWEDF
jgi:hypothetical protein